MGVGTCSGMVYVYDIRNNKPFLIKDHMYEDPIHSLEFSYSKNLQEDIVCSSDKHGTKIWTMDTSEMITTIETDKPCNAVVNYPQSGLFLYANEAQKCEIHFVPTVDPAPKWCSFLDNVTEELEENEQLQPYDDFRFVSEEELEALDLGHLKGTNMIRPALHGFYIYKKLYNRAASAKIPVTLEIHKKERIKQQMMKEREERVKLFKLPEVNKDLAVALLSKKARITQSDLENPVGDERFAKMFSDARYQVDQEAPEYKISNSALKKNRSKVDETPTEVLIDKIAVEPLKKRSNFKYKSVTAEGNQDTVKKVSLKKMLESEKS